VPTVKPGRVALVVFAGSVATSMKPDIGCELRSMRKSTSLVAGSIHRSSTSPFDNTLAVNIVGAAGAAVAVKVAVTVRLLVSETMQSSDATWSQPDQLESTEFDAGIAVTVLVVPAGTSSLQSAPQVMPVPETVPVPLPLFTTKSV
jgi:hypothetical protein